MYPQSMFEEKYEKYQNFLSENIPFLVVKFSIYLNRRVFVMDDLSRTSKTDCSPIPIYRIYLNI